ncbi:MAG: methyltransferase domain-containing protein [Saprospiraceae bacterium]|nr:methyltransferase domain-containing protein [Saprospiraceae bacterium]
MIYKFSIIEKLLLANDIIPHPFADAASSVGLGFALGTAIKLKIADQLSMDYLSIDDIATGAKVSRNGAEIILNCLDALGYVVKNNNTYAFTKRGFKNLSPHSPNNFRYFILFCDHLYRGYLNLDETIRLGKRPQSSMLEEMSAHEWELFSRAMIDISSTNYKEVCGKIPIQKQYKQILDLGGSHGLYSIELCNRNANLQAKIVDLPPVAKYAQECIGKSSVSSRVSFIAADFMKDVLPPENDVILAFNIIHGLNVSENLHLAQKAYQLLNPGGIFVILDQIKGIGGSSQLAKATTSYMALNLLHQAGGNTYSFDEIQEFATNAGFKSAVMKKLNAPGFGLVISTK